MFLTPDDVATLTGYRQPARQIRWLVLHAWRFEVGGDGLPKVSQAYADARFGVPPGPKRRGPKLEHLRTSTTTA